MFRNIIVTCVKYVHYVLFRHELRSAEKTALQLL